MSDFLFGVDLEDPRLTMPDGARMPDRLPALTELYLEFLRQRRAKGTFFVVGDVARAHPALIAAIAGEGHEIACHSDRHVPLDLQSPAEFRDDVRRNLDALADAGAGDIRGYRAPSFSLTEATAWAYEVLAELGFHYSSSVLPARSPLYGWPGFGEAPRRIAGVLELPMTLVHPRLLALPLGGGVYFRALPKAVLRRAFAARARRGTRAVTGYFHPYDIDEAAERIAFPGFRRWGLANWLLHFNRRSVFDRLNMVARLGFSFAPYGPFAERFEKTSDAGAPNVR